MALHAGGRRVFACQGEVCLRVVELCARPLGRRMAGLACRREARVLVIGISGRIVACKVAGGAVLRRPTVLSVPVALHALHRAMFPGKREFGVAEVGTFPLCCRMAHRTIRGETRVLVVWIRRRVVRREVAGTTLLRGSRILAVDVALRAGRCRMLSGERELRLRVVKLRALPLGRGVARLACRRKGRSLVIRIGRRVVGCKMAGGAVLGRACILPVHMALRARRRAVFAGERELRVVERSALPLTCCMAYRTIRGETRIFVVGIRRRVVRREVTGTALLCGPGVLAVDVTLLAGGRHVLACQWEFCLRVVELRSFPLRGCVARLAGRGETSRFVVRVGGPVERIDMARDAVLWRPAEPSVNVALRALRRTVLSSERELRVVECSALPLRSCMAQCAIGGEARSLVVRIRRRVVCRQMARIALLRSSRVLAVDMALLAGGRCVLACQREVRL